MSAVAAIGAVAEDGQSQAHHGHEHRQRHHRERQVALHHHAAEQGAEEVRDAEGQEDAGHSSRIHARDCFEERADIGEEGEVPREDEQEREDAKPHAGAPDQREQGS